MGHVVISFTQTSYRVLNDWIGTDGTYLKPPVYMEYPWAGGTLQIVFGGGFGWEASAFSTVTKYGYGTGTIVEDSTLSFPHAISRVAHTGTDLLIVSGQDFTLNPSTGFGLQRWTDDPTPVLLEENKDTLSMELAFDPSNPTVFYGLQKPGTQPDPPSLGRIVEYSVSTLLPTGSTWDVGGHLRHPAKQLVVRDGIAYVVVDKTFGADEYVAAFDLANFPGLVDSWDGSEVVGEFKFPTSGSWVSLSPDDQIVVWTEDTAYTLPLIPDAQFIAALNTAATVPSGKIFRVAIGLLEDGGDPVSPTMRLEYRVNGGTWGTVTSNTPVQYEQSESPDLVAGYSQLKAAQSATFRTATAVYEEGGDWSVSSVENSKFEWCPILSLDGGQLASTDVVELRVIRDIGDGNGFQPLNSYLQYPQLQIDDTTNRGVGQLVEPQDTAALTGEPLYLGDMAATEAPDIVAMDGVVPSDFVSGTLAATEQADTMSFSGTVTSPLEGDLAATEAPDTALFGGGDQAWTLIAPTYVGASPLLNDADVSNPVGVAFKPDGTKMFIGMSSQHLVSYDLSEPWDVSDITREQFVSFVGSDGIGVYVGAKPTFRDDGLDMIATSLVNQESRISRWSLSTAWDIGSMVYDYRSPELLRDADGAAIVDDVLLHYSSTDSGDPGINLAELPAAWDVTSATELGDFSNTTRGRALVVSPDGTKMFVLTTPDTVQEWSISTTGGVPSGTLLRTFNVGQAEPDSQHIYVSPDGKHLYVVGFFTDVVHHWLLVPEVVEGTPLPPEERFATAYDYADAAAAKPTALVSPVDVKRSIDTDVNNLATQPKEWDIEVHIGVGELQYLVPGNLIFVKADIPGLRDGRKLLLKSYNVRNANPAIPVAMTLWG